MENDILRDAIGFFASGTFAVLFVALGLPLFLKRIGRNYFFGYRISQYAMLDDDIWYAVNRLGGKHLMIIGAFLFANTIFAGMFIGQRQTQGIILYVDLGIMIIGLIYSLIKGRALNNRLAREKGLKNHIHPKNVYKINP